VADIKQSPLIIFSFIGGIGKTKRKDYIIQYEIHTVMPGGEGKAAGSYTRVLLALINVDVISYNHSFSCCKSQETTGIL
jgi:hypothetical protein